MEMMNYDHTVEWLKRVIKHRETKVIVTLLMCYLSLGFRSSKPSDWLILRHSIWWSISEILPITGSGETEVFYMTGFTTA